MATKKPVKPNALVMWRDDIGQSNHRGVPCHLQDFPPRQMSASFSLDQVIEKMTEASKGA